jgi:hypothetical protein
MLNRLRLKLTYANVTATLALFVALGGSSYAALNITGRDVKNRSLTWRDLKRNTLGGSRIKESRLGKVRRARNADYLNGVTAARLLVKCPADTFPAGGTCIETRTRVPAAYGTAVNQCATAGGSTTPARRLPTHGELQAAFSRLDPAPGGELTGQVWPRTDGRLNVLVIASKTGGTNTVVPDDGNSPRAFRCAADPLN